MSRNSIFLQGGQVGRAPELKYSQKNTAYMTLSVCTNDSWFNANTNKWESKPTWHPVKLFGKLAERIAAEVDKGWEVHLRGRYEEEKWQDKDGNQRSRQVIIPDATHLWCYPPKQRTEQREPGDDFEPAPRQQQRPPAARQQARPPAQRPYSGDAQEYAWPDDDSEPPF